MKFTNHALEQLDDRYKKWGLNIDEFISYVHILNVDIDDKYRMILFDDIPVILICDQDQIITVYPHPVDAAEEWRDLLSSMNSAKKGIQALNKSKIDSDRYIKKLERKIAKLEKSLRRYYNQ